MWIYKKPFIDIIHFALILLLWFKESFADNECAARYIEGESVICVCNSTYCDDIVREEPRNGRFVTYTSSESGLRFKKSGGILEKLDSQKSYPLVLELNPSCVYQTCEGFGGAVTDAASINWKSLPENMQQDLIDSYFSEKGLEYNMLRLPIGGTDFSTHQYAYNELPTNDKRLTNYTLVEEDLFYKIPMIKKAMEVATSPLHIVATTWSPPRWMKTDFNFSHCGVIAPEYYQTYADYHIKFFEKYGAAGISIWGVTTTNEPSNGLGDAIQFNCLGWTPDTMGDWIANNLGPTIRNSKFKDVKILCCDDQRPNIPFWVNALTDIHPKALDFIDGVAVHFYQDPLSSPVYLTTVAQTHPDLFVINTEACNGFKDNKVILGSWQRAEVYITDILQDLNHNVVGWIDWNLCLDTKGGPNWIGNFVDSPIIINATAKEFYKQPMFYAMGHFSKFIPRGSRRIDVRSEHQSNVLHVAFLTPKDTIVVVMYNNGTSTTVALRMGDKEAIVPLEAKAICTVEFSYNLYEERNEIPFYNKGDDDNVRVKSIELKLEKPVVIKYKLGTITII